jgi:tetratricopeptide (TPR) repeat protein
MEQRFNVKLPNCEKPVTSEQQNHAQGGSKIGSRRHTGILPPNLDFTPNPDRARRALLEKRLAAASDRIASNRGDPVALIERGLLLSDLGDQDAAEKDFNEGLLSGLSAEGINGRGLARLRKGRLEEARSDFLVACSLQPSNVSFVGNLDDAEAIADDLEMTVKYLLAALVHRPTDGEICFRLGLAYVRRGDLKDAREWLAKAIANGDALVRERAEIELDLLGTGRQCRRVANGRFIRANTAYRIFHSNASSQNISEMFQ